VLGPLKDRLVGLVSGGAIKLPLEAAVDRLAEDEAAALAACATLHLGVWLWTIIGR
jgi:hypothetical protein